jgi:hypothetical protein
VQHSLSKLFFVSLLLLGFSGCFEENINPSNGSTEVPVNAVIRFRVEGDRFVDPDQINSEKVILRECAAPSGGGGSTQNKPGTPEQSPTPGTPESQGGAGGPAGSGPVVQGRFAQKRACLLPVGQTTRNGPELPSDKDRDWPCREGETYRTDLFFIPQAASSKDTPLKEGTEYCFEVKQMTGISRETDKDKVTFEGGTSRFTTEANASFHFARPSTKQNSVTKLKYATKEDKGRKVFDVHGDDIIVFYLEYPAFPDSLSKGTVICEDPTKPDSSQQQTATQNVDRDSQDKCENVFAGGREFTPTMFQIDFFKNNPNLPAPKNKYVLADYKIYGVKSTRRMFAGQRYAVIAGLGANAEGIDRPADDRDEFKVVKNARGGDAVLFVQNLLKEKNQGPAVIPLASEEKQEE